MPDTTPRGYFALVLHSHLPYVVGHGTWPHGIDWLHEAAAETYLPLLDVFHDLMVDGITPNVSVGITPVLGEQLNDDRFKTSFPAYLQARMDAAASDADGFRAHGQEGLAGVAEWWHAETERLLDHYLERYHRDLIGAFRALQDAGAIEILTCAATHGYLPLLGEDACVRAQVRAGVATSERLFGTAPHGIWLPECAYRPAYGWTPPVEGFGDARHRAGVEHVLQEQDVRYFVVDTHLLAGGAALGPYHERFEALQRIWQESQAAAGTVPDHPLPPDGLYQVTPDDELPAVRVVARDPRTSLQVWSASRGYPGDPVYLEFHKKNFPGGLRYWRLTGPDVDLGDKDLYNPGAAAEQTRSHARHFCGLIRERVHEGTRGDDDPAVITAPFDTELFGHWWAEGPQWIGHVLRELHGDPDVAVATLGEINARVEPRAIISLPEGSWGEGGFHNVWLNEDTAWTWAAVYECEQSMVEWATRYAETADPQTERLLNDLARTLLLLESSDWQFLITTVAARDYAEDRFNGHCADFRRLADVCRRTLDDGAAFTKDDAQFLDALETRDSLFTDLDFRWWADGPA